MNKYGFFISFAVTSVAIAGQPGNRFQRVTTAKVDGMIVQAENAADQALPYHRFWTPSQGEVAELENKLPYFLKQKNEHGRVTKQLSEVIQRLHSYRRQYVGYIESGHKRIFVNCLPMASKNDDLSLWDRQVIDVADGGSDFWSVVYDVGTHEFSNLFINGRG